MKRRGLLIALLLTVLACTPFMLQAGTLKVDQASAASIDSPSINTADIMKNSNLDPNRQWALSAIQAPEAWTITSGNPGTIIAILDTGIDDEHEDLAGQVIDKVNFTISPTANDIYGHGTHIAGIIAAKNNDRGITGTAYNCRLLNVKIADDGGWLDEQALAKGIRWAVDHGACVINISLYTFNQVKEVDEAVKYAWEKGALIIGPSGNGVGEKDVYPSGYANCISTAATNTSNKVPAWSGCSNQVNVAAPGSDVLSTIPGNKYELKSGTSMASAYTSGVAGLLFSMRPGGSTTQNSTIRSIIINSCDPLDSGPIGRINALKAVQMMQKQQNSNRDTTEPVNP